MNTDRFLFYNGLIAGHAKLFDMDQLNKRIICNPQCNFID
jgi:hypothetical protein